MDLSKWFVRSKCHDSWLMWVGNAEESITRYTANIIQSNAFVNFGVARTQLNNPLCLSVSSFALLSHVQTWFSCCLRAVFATLLLPNFFFMLCLPLTNHTSIGWPFICPSLLVADTQLSKSPSVCPSMRLSVCPSVHVHESTSGEISLLGARSEEQMQ